MATILERNQTRYVIEVKYSRWWLLVTAVCLWLGLGIILDATTITLTCRRVESDEGQCEFIKARLLNLTTQSISLDRIDRAMLYTTTYYDRRRDPHNEYHVVMTLRSADPLEIYASSDWFAQHRFVDNINAFLTRPRQASLNVTRDAPARNFAIAVLIIAFGLWWAASLLKITTFTFDKSIGTLTIQSRLIWTRLKTLLLTDILDLEIRETEPDNKRSPARRVYIVLRGQQDITTPLPDDDELVLSLRIFLSKPHIP